MLERQDEDVLVVLGAVSIERSSTAFLELPNYVDNVSDCVLPSSPNGVTA